MIIISVANNKGGVGKTTTTLNVGAALADLNQRVLLVDLDPQASLTIYMGYDPAEIKKAFNIRKAKMEQLQIDAKQNTKSAVKPAGKYDWEE